MARLLCIDRPKPSDTCAISVVNSTKYLRKAIGWLGYTIDEPKALDKRLDFCRLSKDPISTS